MLIVSMGAGLGNQLFEYAFYSRLKLQYPDQIVKLDIKYAFPVAHNGIEIFDIFDLEKDIATKQEVLKLTKGHHLRGEGFGRCGIFERVYRKMGLCPKNMIVQEKFTGFYEDYLKLYHEGSKYFWGPFANYKYFFDCQDTIKNMYDFPTIDDHKNKEYAERIHSCNSVAIHIRRGDYLTDNVNVVPMEYYYRAIGKMEECVSEPHYYVFSDDIAYAKEHFGDENKYTIVDGNSGMFSFRDMQLMSMCKHNIITNSTFSFWAAFLNRNNEKIVIGPNIPFNKGDDLFSFPGWTVLDI